MPSVAFSPPPSPSSRSRKGSKTAAPRPSSPTGSVGTAKSCANSPHPAPTRKLYRRCNSTTFKVTAGLARSTSNSSISRSSCGNANVNHVAPPPPLEGDNASLGISYTPLPTPTGKNASSFLFDEKLTGSSPNQSHKSNNTIQPDPRNPDHRRSLPRPPPPSRCPLLCVFYAEFDIVVGPKVCFQSPQNFMNFDVDVSYKDVHDALEETFQAVILKEDEKQPLMAGGNINNKNGNKQLNGEEDSARSSGIYKEESDEYWNWTPSKKKIMNERETPEISPQFTRSSSSHVDDKQNAETYASITAIGSASWSECSTEAKAKVAKEPVSGKSSREVAKESVSGKSLRDRKQSGASTHDAPDDTTNDATNNATNATAQMTLSRNPSFASSSKGPVSNQPTHEGDTSTIDTELLQNSIFAATSEYIITGNELANQTITVSTHGMHILSRPMVISDTQRYERNNLLFAVGFVLRRNVDPRPYWPVLANLSSTFQSMEVESEFLSHHRTRPQVQIVLEDILVSLNSKQKDCHILLNDANMLNLHLFRPPPPPTPPVPDYVVPILLRPEWQLQMYDWDLTINWIVPHIDGCKFVKQIAISSAVDMEMVRACLRVLKHHGVLAYVDVFRYSNVYEYTPLAMGLLTGTAGKRASEVKDAAFRYSAKAKYIRQAQLVHRAANKDQNSTGFSPSRNAARRLHPHLSSLDLSIHSSTAACTSAVAAEPPRWQSTTAGLPRSFPSRAEHVTIREENSMEEDASPGTANKGATGNQSGANSSHLKQTDMMKRALTQLYSSCSRNQTFGEMFLAKIAKNENKTDRSPSADNVRNEIKQQKQGKDAPDMSIDWKMAFDYFDHRRLITFGVVHGLIRRVHQYPLAYEIGTDTDEANISGNGRDASSNSANDDESDDFSQMGMSLDQYHSPIARSIMAEVAAATAAAAGNTAKDEWSTSYSASPLPQGFPTPPLSSRDVKNLNELKRREMHLRSRKLLLEKIASSMDGTRCDDELSIMFEVQVEKLIEMLKVTGRWNIISVFSCAN